MTRKNEKGAVLIIVLFILAGLAIVSVELSRNVLLDHSFSQAVRASISSKPLLASGEEIAAQFLVRDFRSSGGQEGIESQHARNLRFRDWLEKYSGSLKHSDMDIVIEDENARFPLAALFPVYSSDKQRADFYAGMLARILASLLITHGYEGGENAARSCAEEFVESLLAWSGSAALSSSALKWYISREIPYVPPGRPPESFEELLLVYWPSVDEKLAKNALLGTDTLPGLLENCSIWSTGPININTIKTVVGWGLAPSHQQALSFMESFEQGRASQGETLRPGWHREIFSAFAIPQPPLNAFSEQSRWYRIHIRIKQGAAQNAMESIGWITKDSMTLVSRAII